MRTIRLTEHQTTPQALNERELEQLLTLGHVGVRPRGDGSFDLRPSSVVGTIVFPSFRVLVRPKVGMPNVLFLLSYGEGLTRWSEAPFPYEEDDFVGAIGRMLEAAVRRAGGFGLVREYREEEEEALPTLRGRVDIATQLRRRHGEPFPLDCRFEEFDEDTLLNRVVKAALRRLVAVPALDHDVRLQLRHHLGLFATVADLEFRPSAVPDLIFTRRNAMWEDAARLAQLVLRSAAVRDAVGTVMASSFTVDMNALFERFVERVVDEVARERSWILEGQARRRLTDRVSMKPDFVLRRGHADRAVGDAKYKELAPEGWPHADLYQLLAYCVALGLDEGLLVYGEADRSRREVVRRAGIALEIVGVDLGAQPANVLEATRAAALRLVEQAQRHAQQVVAA